jgi:uncharacterized Zn-binding protein involved in type VI secretion
VLHDIAGGIGKVTGTVMMPIQMLNEGFAKATNFIAKALPCFPAATMGSIALGLPHAHYLHPPSMLTVPPLPLPPIGPILLGCSVQVLINGKPAARCGDLGVAPTCCGLPPIFEVFTGSSKVFIAGARAARQLDVTYHCKPIPPAGSATRGAITAARTAMSVAMKGMAIGAKGMMVAGLASQGLNAVGDGIEAAQTDDSAMSAALAMSAAATGAQIAMDVAAIAAGAMMGKDLCAPPGTPGAITINTSPNVHIGGFPMPSWMNIAKGLLKAVKAFRAKKPRSRPGRSSKKGKGKKG